MSTEYSLWNCSIEEITNGFKPSLENRSLSCLLCGKQFEQGIVYPFDDFYFDAEKMMRKHIEIEHGSTFDYLLSLDKNFTGVSPNQKEVLLSMHEGLSDEEIAKKLKISISTIRNYRFRFKEKEKQAKIFMSLMRSLELKVNTDEEIILPLPSNASSIYEKYGITENDRTKTLESAFDENGHLLVFPRKEKKKIIILSKIIENFKPNKTYNENEVNRVLKRIYEDNVAIRRYLIEYGFLDRNKDGSKYWVSYPY